MQIRRVAYVGGLRGLGELVGLEVTEVWGRGVEGS